MLKITKGGVSFAVNNFPWDNGGAKPETSVKVSYDEGGYNISFVSYETDIRAEVEEHNGPVHEDSCVELFAAFAEGDERYINIEVNPKGTAHCECGEGRHNRLQISPEDIEGLNITTRIFDDRWEADYRISVEFIKKFLPTYEHKIGACIKANFYKCGDKTGHEHYGCFNNIPWQSPDFHRPEFFAELVLD